MSDPHETAYPRFKCHYSQKELESSYTPDAAEIALSRQHTRNPVARLHFLTLLKTAQHMGYFAKFDDIPSPVVRFLASALGYTYRKTPSLAQLQKHDRSGARQRHFIAIRHALGIQPYDQQAADLGKEVALRSAQVKEHVVDIINEILEELVHQRYELPVFSVVDTTASRARRQARQDLFSCYKKRLISDIIRRLDQLLLVDAATNPFSLWHQYRRECGKPTTKAIKEYLVWLASVKQQAGSLPELEGVSAVRKQALFHEARSYDAASMRRLDENKRYTLTALLVRQRYASALDDIGNIFIRLVRQLHHTAKKSYQEYLLKHTGDTNKLVSRLHQILLAWKGADNVMDTVRVDQLLEDHTEQWISACEQHLQLDNDNYFPFLITPFQKKRSQLFNCLALLSLISTSEDDRIIQALAWIKSNQVLRRPEFCDVPESLKDGSWLPGPWKKLVIHHRVGDPKPVWRRNYLELAVFTLTMEALNAGDLSIDASDQYSDYRHKLVSWQECDNLLGHYGECVGLPTVPEDFVQHLKGQLSEAATAADTEFPGCEQVCFKDGRLVLSRPEGKPRNEKVVEIQRLLDDRLPTLSILDLLVEGEHWVGLHKMFGPPSGEKSRLSDPRKRFVATLFCYGCNLGPSQVARSVKGLSRKQVAWLNIGYISEEALDQAIVKVINAYNRFQLPKHWGTGERAAADGTRWDVYEQNLLSEYHVRYGSYGGIGYYFVSDTYAALFSRFITCGTYEGIYILDGLMKNTSDIQPGIVHGDTHAQNEPAFGLAYLLGIELMPRIRKISGLHFYRPAADTRYEHIDSLFQQSVQWDLIRQHLPDMMRVAISIQQGTIDPSAILQRLGSGTRKNRLYFAFRELGRAVKTRFLLKYIMDIELRKTISQATNKCEEFNDFCKWLMFGGDGVIAENLRHEQRKVIKYNHLVSNLVILHNVQNMSQALKAMADEGLEITPAILADLSPYRRKHINRFGDYRLDTERAVPGVTYDLVIPVNGVEFE